MAEEEDGRCKSGEQEMKKEGEQTGGGQREEGEGENGGRERVSEREKIRQAMEK